MHLLRQSFLKKLEMFHVPLIGDVIRRKIKKVMKRNGKELVSIATIVIIISLVSSMMAGIMPGRADQTAEESAKTSVGMTSASDNSKAVLSSRILSKMSNVGHDEMIPVIVVMKAQPTKTKTDFAMLSKQESIQSIKSLAENTQKDIAQALGQAVSSGKAEDIKQFWIVNAIAVKATPDVIEQLARRADVARIEPDLEMRIFDSNADLYDPLGKYIEKPAKGAKPTKPSKEEQKPSDILRSGLYQYTAWGVNWIEAPELWARGINGTWINVSVVDTGIDASHPDLQGKVIAWNDFVNSIPHSGTYVWYSGEGNNLDNTLDHAFNLTDVASATLKFWTKYDIEYGYDVGYVNISTDGGVTWSTLARYTDYSDYTQQILDLTPYAGNNVILRFHYHTDYSMAYEGWYIDDIEIPEIGFLDDVESGADGWAAAGWRIARNNALWYSGMGNNLDNTLDHAFDLTGVSSATLNFSTKYDTESCCDFCYVEVSTDNGYTWDILATYSGYSPMTQKIISLTPYAGNNVLLQFHYHTDSSVVYEGWYIDDIAIPEIGFFDDVESGADGWLAYGWYIWSVDTPYDDHGHGTHCAGTIAGIGKAGINTGVAPGANLFGAKVFNKYGYGSMSTTMQGMQWSVDNGADIISYSGGVPLPIDANYGEDIVEHFTTSNQTIYVYPSMDSAFKPASIIGEVMTQNVSELQNLSISLIAPNGTVVQGDEMNWLGLIPENVWIYKYSENNPLLGGNWTLSITTNSPTPINYSYLLLVAYPSDGTDIGSQAVNNIASIGVVPVIAAGNDGVLGLRTIASPASANDAITVGATEYYMDYIAVFSSRGPVGYGAETIKPDVCAPGVWVVSTYPGGEYEEMSGTSMATPHVSGTAALLLQADPSLSPIQVKQKLESTAIDPGKPGMDNSYGAGRISAYAAVNATITLPEPHKERPQNKYELFAGAANNYPDLNGTMKLIAFSWNDTSGTPEAGINITFAVDNWNWPYYHAMFLEQTNESGMACVDVVANRTGMWHITITDEAGNYVHDYAYVYTYTPPTQPFDVLSKYYHTMANTTVQVKYTLIKQEFEPYNENVTLRFGYDYFGYDNVTVNLTPVNGTISYDLDLSNTTIDESSD
jgi:subtilisin family serine protease